MIHKIRTPKMIPKIERSKNHPKSGSKIGQNRDPKMSQNGDPKMSQNGDPKMIQNGDLKHQTPLPIKLPLRAVFKLSRWQFVENFRSVLFWSYDFCWILEVISILWISSFCGSRHFVINCLGPEILDDFWIPRFWG